MKLFFVILVIVTFMALVVSAASTALTINGGICAITGGEVSVYLSSTTTVVVSNVGQCIGILCGVTYAN